MRPSIKYAASEQNNPLIQNELTRDDLLKLVHDMRNGAIKRQRETNRQYSQLKVNVKGKLIMLLKIISTEVMPKSLHESAILIDLINDDINQFGSKNNETL